MIRLEQTPSEQSLSRVKAWLASEKTPRAQIAKDAGVDEKTLRLATDPRVNWNPTVSTLQKLEAVMPQGWRQKKARAAA